MRLETAVRRLRTVAARCQQAAGLWQEQPVLLAGYTFGALLDRPGPVEVVQLAFVLDLPAEELTWCARPVSCSGLPRLLELDKAPVDWYWRPAAWPVGNHAIRRPLRIWSLDGPDHAAIDALARAQAEPLRLPAPTDAELDRQLAMELDASLAHLRRVERGYWQHGWRSTHRGSSMDPEHSLWDAVHGYLDLLGAVHATRRRTQAAP